MPKCENCNKIFYGEKCPVCGWSGGSFTENENQKKQQEQEKYIEQIIKEKRAQQELTQEEKIQEEKTMEKKVVVNNVQREQVVVKEAEDNTYYPKCWDEKEEGVFFKNIGKTFKVFAKIIWWIGTITLVGIVGLWPISFSLYAIGEMIENECAKTVYLRKIYLNTAKDIKQKDIVYTPSEHKTSFDNEALPKI